MNLNTMRLREQDQKIVGQIQLSGSGALDYNLVGVERIKKNLRRDLTRLEQKELLDQFLKQTPL